MPAAQWLRGKVRPERAQRRARDSPSEDRCAARRNFFSNSLKCATISQISDFWFATGKPFATKDCVPYCRERCTVAAPCVALSTILVRCAFPHDAPKKSRP